MPKKKNKNLIGIVIGAIAAVTIIGFSAFALNKWSTPIKLVSGSAEGASSNTSQDKNPASNDDVEVEEDIWGDDLSFGELEEEEEILLDGEINIEDETQAVTPNNNSNYNSTNYENLKLPEINSTVNSTIPPVSNTNNNTNNNTNSSTTKANGKDTGFFGYEYDDLDPDKSYFFTSKDAWQRNFGFCKIYDDASPLIAFYYDTERILFTYGEYDWMIQLWKGQYGFIFIGSEIGVYHKEKGRDIEFYDCAEDKNCLKMKMALYRDEDTMLFDRPEGYYWWTTGFVPGKLDRFADRSELKVVAKITFFDDTMTKAFIEGFEAAGFVEKSKWVEPDVETNKAYARKKFYTVSGNTVSFTWQ